MIKPVFFMFLGIFGLGMGITAGYFGHYSEQIAMTQQVAHRPDFHLPDLKGKIHYNSEWDGKVVLINFWATWCPPCLEEIPVFMQAQKQYAARGLQVVGIAIDQEKAVRTLAQRMKINYLLLVGEDQGIKVAKSFGNSFGGLPFTAVVNRRGQIVKRYLGEIDKATVEEIILPLLDESLGKSSI
jgi:thiol-disulfide isomerase/thioredoxin